MKGIPLFHSIYSPLRGEMEKMDGMGAASLPFPDFPENREKREWNELSRRTLLLQASELNRDYGIVFDSEKASTGCHRGCAPLGDTGDRKTI